MGYNYIYTVDYILYIYTIDYILYVCTIDYILHILILYSPIPYSLIPSTQQSCEYRNTSPLVSVRSPKLETHK